MKKNIIAIVAVVTLLFLSQGCSNTQVENSTSPKNSETIDVEGENVANVITRTSIYEIRKEKELYGYSLFNKAGEVVKSESDLVKQPHITSIENDVVRVTVQAGTGLETQWGFYYDQGNNRESKIFYSILGEQNGVVAYATMDRVILENIFEDADLVHQEIASFHQPLSKTAFPFVAAEFNESNSMISITYYSGEDDAETTEHFALKLQPLNIVWGKDDNFEILTNAEGTAYRYCVYDNNGQLLDQGFHDFRGCGFSVKGGYLCYYDASLTFQWAERYYDVEKGLVSPSYYRPLDTRKNLVAYYDTNSDGKTVLIIRDIFDTDAYYFEISRAFNPSVWTGGSTGSFSEDATTFTLTYIVTHQENKTETTVTETIQLPQ